MKKIISFVLILTMLLGIAAVNASAAGVLVQSNFSDMGLFTQNFHAGAFYTEDNLLFGYSEAKCLQTLGEWYTYDAFCEVAIADDELNDADRYFSVVYPNTNLMNYGREEGSYYMSFNYDVANKQVYLTGGWVGCDLDDIIVGPIPYEGVYDDGSGFNTFGISVSRGRIRCFIDNNLVIDFVDSKDEYLIGLEDENTVPTAHVFWNDGNFIQFKDVKISTSEYLYPATPVVDDTQTTATTQGGEDNGTNNNGGNSTAAPTQPVETTTRKEIVDVTDDKGNAVTDDKGNKVTEEIIITDPPVADTNPNNGVGGVGTATPTGDKAIMVVAAMVITLGCALIVKKVNID